jgi:hypothetical protein
MKAVFGCPYPVKAASVYIGMNLLTPLGSIEPLWCRADGELGNGFRDARRPVHTHAHTAARAYMWIGFCWLVKLLGNIRTHVSWKLPPGGNPRTWASSREAHRYPALGALVRRHPCFDQPLRLTLQDTPGTLSR